MTEIWTKEKLDAYLAGKGKKRSRSFKTKSLEGPKARVSPEEEAVFKGRRFIIRYTSYRPRFIDSDNYWTKWITDCIVEARIIPEDSPKYLDHVQFRQVKSDTKYTIIEIFELTLEDN